jgi:hypothetical protein
MMTPRLAFVSFALLCLAVAPAPSPAQDAGVSGIPSGPGNVNGLNGSIRDPSGIGNAAKMPVLPQPNLSPVVPPAAAALSGTSVYGSLPPEGVTQPRLVRPRFARSRYGRRAVRAAVRENNRLLDRKLTTICRGC